MPELAEALNWKAVSFFQATEFVKLGKSLAKIPGGDPGLSAELAGIHDAANDPWCAFLVNYARIIGLKGALTGTQFAEMQTAVLELFSKAATPAECLRFFVISNQKFWLDKDELGQPDPNIPPELWPMVVGAWSQNLPTGFPVNPGVPQIALARYIAIMEGATPEGGDREAATAFPAFAFLVERIKGDREPKPAANGTWIGTIDPSSKNLPEPFRCLSLSQRFTRWLTGYAHMPRQQVTTSARIWRAVLCLSWLVLVLTVTAFAWTYFLPPHP